MHLITTGISRDGFVLPANHSWDAKLINGKKEGRVTVKDGYGIITHVLPYVNDQLNGIAELYNHGELAEKRTFKNNIEEGWSCEYERGREVRWFMYSNGVKKGELKKYDNMDGFWELYDIGSGSLLSICKYDINHKCIGKGYLYDNNHINRVVTFTSPDIEGLILKSFNGDEMIEYDIHGNEIYKGGYKDTVAEDYPREGKGREFVNNVLTYEGDFHHNIREGTGSSYREGKLEYSGEWKNNLPDGNGWMTVEDKVYDGKWVKGRYNVEGNIWFNYSSGKNEETPEESGSSVNPYKISIPHVISPRFRFTELPSYVYSKIYSMFYMFSPSWSPSSSLSLLSFTGGACIASLMNGVFGTKGTNYLLGLAGVLIGFDANKRNSMVFCA